MPSLNLNLNTLGTVSKAGVSSIDFTGITNYVFLGDSISAGSNATVGNSYRELLVTNYATTNTDYSVGGRGTWREIKEIHTQGFTRSQTVIWEEAGLNDLRRSNVQATKNKIESCVKSVIKKTFALSGVAAGSNSVTRSGTFTPYDAESNGGVYPNLAFPDDTACFSSTVNDYWEYTFSGDNCYIVFGAADSSKNRGDCEIRVDGDLVDTITDLNDRADNVSDGDDPNDLVPDTRFYRGFGSGSHTLRITVTSAFPVPVDQIGTLDDPSNVGVLMLIQIPYVTDYSKVGLDQANDSVIDAGNQIKIDLVNEFKALGYRIGFARIMQGKGGLYDLANIDSDGVHPTNAGHLQIYNSLIRYIG